jgi:hypothetical protein
MKNTILIALLGLITLSSQAQIQPVEEINKAK